MNYHGLIALTILFVMNHSINGATFLPLGHLQGGRFYSYASGISADGRVVVGTSASANGTEAFRWTAEQGMVGLGDLPGGDFFSEAYGVSSDGSVIVGRGDVDGHLHAFRWTAKTGMVVLGPFPGSTASSATAVSGSGNVVFGSFASATNPSEAFRWSSDQGIVAIGDLPGGQLSSSVSAVTPDGTIAVGSGHTQSGTGRFTGRVAALWTEVTDWVVVEPGLIHQSSAGDVSEDGSVIVGYFDRPYSPRHQISEAFLWTRGVGLIGLGTLPGNGDDMESYASAVTPDGSIVVGHSGNTTFKYEAFIWDAESGMRRIEDLLTNAGFDLSEWRLADVGDISADGTTLVGFGVNPDGFGEAWLASISDLSRLEGDYDGNGGVDQGDLDLVLLNWGLDGLSRPTRWIRNAPSAGIIDQEELDSVLSNWGATQNTLTISAVSEPTSIGLLGIVFIYLLNETRRRAL